MVETLNIEINKVAESRLSQVDFNNIQFGKIYSDHMFRADYDQGEWKRPKIEPYGYLPISPANQTLHYGVSIFEGMKAYKHQDGSVALFRPLENQKRLNRSAERLCMPDLPEDIFMEGLTRLMQLDKNWVPNLPDTALYIRPFMFSSEEYVGIKISEQFTFLIITSPVGAYYTNPLKVKIEMEFARAVKGGTGYAKAAGNYAGALYPSKLAQQQGYQQLIWTDGQEHKYIEEAGTMNLFFVINDTLVTPELTDTFLPGITRDSIIKLSKHLGFKIEERKITVEEVVDALKSKTMTEAFGVGTAATLTSISHIGYKGTDYEMPNSAGGYFSSQLQNNLEDIKTGKIVDPFGWIHKIT
ncbi:MAG: branched-chain amino acid aminotransferase [Cyclobacteriaceae bacterium]|nr:branched-chain amino acid aminotransferase [Cyclobacteriaceae bacterium]